MKGKCVQSSGFNKRGVLDVSYDSYDPDAFARGEDMHQTARKGTVMQLDDDSSKVNVTVATECKHVIMDQQIREKSKISNKFDNTTADGRNVYARRTVIPSSTFKSRQHFIWYVEVHIHTYVLTKTKL